MQELHQYLNKITPLSEETWGKLAGLFVEKKLNKQAYFSKAGIVAHKIAFLQKGVVRSFYTNHDGQEFNKNFFVAPAIIGAYTSLITHTPNKLAQQALTNCLIWEADHDKVKNLYDTCPDLERLARLRAEYYFVEKEIREVNLLTLDAKEHYQFFQKQYPSLEQQIPQYHIASYLGITPTQLSRIRGGI